VGVPDRPARRMGQQWRGVGPSLTAVPAMPCREGGPPVTQDDRDGLPVQESVCLGWIIRLRIATASARGHGGGIIADAQCKKAFRKDMTTYEEADEFCPHCDNHYVSRRGRGGAGGSRGSRLDVGGPGGPATPLLSCRVCSGRKTRTRADAGRSSRPRSPRRWSASKARTRV
jgi:hypothetical protein